MRVDQVSHGVRTTLELVPTAGGSFSAPIALRAEVRLDFPDISDEAIVCVGKQSWSVRGSDSRNDVVLKKLRESNRPRLTWAVNRAPKMGPTERVVLQVHEFAARYDWPDAMDLAIDEKIVTQVRERLSKAVTVEEAVKWLSDAILVPRTEAPDEPYVLLSGSPRLQAEGGEAFRLHGHGVAVDVKRAPDGRLTVIRIVAARHETEGSERRPIALLSAKVRFCDDTIAGVFRGVAKTQLDQLVEGARSYLDLWNKYNARERSIILERARKIGGMRYVACNALPHGVWRFMMESSRDLEVALRELRDGEDAEIEVSERIPPELLTNEHGSEVRAVGIQSAGPRVRSQAAVMIACRPEEHVVEARFTGTGEERTPPKAGYIHLSWSGDKKRLERREAAVSRIASAECPMPQLGLLIEGQPVPAYRRKTHRALSPSARTAFGGDPTTRQAEALHIALNTPDIALIQGPPGTGKTKVIAALMARLAELHEGADGVSGQTLLTSYQHDAVEHASSQVVVFGLPAVKIGRKHGAADEDDGFERWRKERMQAVRANLANMPDLPATEVLRKVRLVAARYMSSPLGQSDPVNVLREVRGLVSGHVPLDLQDRLLALQTALGAALNVRVSDADEDREAASRALRALRTTPSAFMDDGPQSAKRALRHLEACGLVCESERELLEEAINWNGGAPPDFLERLLTLQEEKLSILVGEQSPIGGHSVHEDVAKLLGETVETLNKNVRQSSPGKSEVLYEFLDALEQDAEGVRDAVRQYTTVLAATCQQAVALQMSQAKGDSVVFDSVVVDEAARANPLDMFIPMALAERRIVLVGDHRQLPHILEPDIESQLEDAVSEQTRSALRESLFERLFQLMKEREAQDGVKRTITLDVQYRMHPVLGDFVSKTFYAPHGEVFGSGRLAADLGHDLKGYEDKVAAWVKLRRTAGEESGGRSKRRKPEAMWIAQEVKRLSTQRPDLSFGVISFYAAQVDEILQAMQKQGLAEPSVDGGWRIASDMRETRGSDARLKERLRVGTVDAFQGKEFDVVVLSMTRSNSLPSVSERDLRRKFGHLMLENRLCVAMSRQQRLLIVVGDDEMLHGESGSRAVPGLVAFHALCEGPNGICI